MVEYGSSTFGSAIYGGLSEDAYGTSTFGSGIYGASERIFTLTPTAQTLVALQDNSERNINQVITSSSDVSSAMFYSRDFVPAFAGTGLLTPGVSTIRPLTHLLTANGIFNLTSQRARRLEAALLGAAQLDMELYNKVIAFTQAYAAGASFNAAYALARNVEVNALSTGDVILDVDTINALTQAYAASANHNAALAPSRNVLVDPQGSGDVTLTVSKLVELLQTYNGEGSLSPLLSPRRTVTTDITGNGNVVLGVDTIIALTQSLAGDGTLDSTFTRARSIQPNISGEGSVLLNLDGILALTQQYSGSGQLTPGVSTILSLTQALVGSGTVAVEATRSKTVVYTGDGWATVDALLSPLKAIDSSFSSNAFVTANSYKGRMVNFHPDSSVSFAMVPDYLKPIIYDASGTGNLTEEIDLLRFIGYQGIAGSDVNLSSITSRNLLSYYENDVLLQNNLSKGRGVTLTVTGESNVDLLNKLVRIISGEWVNSVSLQSDVSKQKTDSLSGESVAILNLDTDFFRKITQQFTQENNFDSNINKERELHQEAEGVIDLGATTAKSRSTQASYFVDSDFHHGVSKIRGTAFDLKNSSTVDSELTKIRVYMHGMTASGEVDATILLESADGITRFTRRELSRDLISDRDLSWNIEELIRQIDRSVEEDIIELEWNVQGDDNEE